MLDIIRYDLARMRKMKCFRVIPIIMLVIIAFEDWVVRSGGSLFDVETGVDPAADFEALSVELLMGLFLAIFTVLFVNADISSGFIKTIGGQVKRRSRLICSKFISMAVFELFFMIVAFVGLWIFGLLFVEDVKVESWSSFFPSFGIHFLMNYSLMCFCAAVTVISRSNMLGMIISILTTTQFFDLFLILIERLIKSQLDKTIDLRQYLVTTCLVKAEYYAPFIAGESVSIVKPIVICCVTAVIAIAVSVFSFEKRDIV